MVAATEERVNVVPRGWWMVVEPVKEDKTTGGILLPEGAEPDPQMTTGVVVLQRVVAVSKDPIQNEDGETVPAHDYNVGDVIVGPPGRVLVDSAGRPMAFLLDERNVIAVLPDHGSKGPTLLA